MLFNDEIIKENIDKIVDGVYKVTALFMGDSYFGFF